MNRKVLYGGIAVVVIFVTVVFVGGKVSYNASPKNQVACTMEAKLCPDGSYVGRSGPLCEFAACPKSETGSAYTPTNPVDISLVAKINQPAKGLGVTIAPLEVVEDSRCPFDVVCIQAGTVRVRAAMTTAAGVRTEVFKLDEPVLTRVEQIELVSVVPEARSTIAIRANEYRFTFKISKRFGMEI